MTQILLVVAVLPFVAVLLVLGFRAPLRVLLPAFALFVPFGSAFALPGLPPRYSSLSSLLMLALILGIGAKLVSGRWQPAPVETVIAVWSLFLGVTCATIFWSRDSSATLTTFIPFAGVVVLYVLVRLSPVDATTVRRTERAILVGGVAAATYGIYQLATSSLPTGDQGAARFGRDLLDPNHTATALTLPLAIALGRIISSRRTSERMACFGVVLLLLVAIVLTGSRGGLLSTMAVFVVVLALSRHRVAALVTGSTVVLLLVAILALNPALIPPRLASDDSSGRTDIWTVGIAACGTYCGAGSGWGTFGDVYADTLPTVPQAGITASGVRFEPHNIWLLAAVETGLVGAVLMTVGLALALREAFRLPVGRRGPPLGALAGLLLSGFLLSNLEYKYFWMVLIYAGLGVRVDRSGTDIADTTPDAAEPETMANGDTPGLSSTTARPLSRSWGDR